MARSTQKAREQFEFAFYELIEGFPINDEDGIPLITWVNECELPVLNLSFLLAIDHETRVQIATLLRNYELRAS